MASFDLALPLTLKNEGGLQTLASDPGNRMPDGQTAATNRGITLKTLTAWRLAQGKPSPNVTDIVALSLAETADIYRSLYWDKIAGDKLSDQNVATVLFDASVLQGSGTVVKLAQAVAAGVTGQALLADGQCGPKTVTALNACGRRPLLEPLVHKMQARFLDIVAANPSEKAWAPVWLRRASAWLVLADQ